MSNLDVRWVAGLVGPLRVRPGSEVKLPGDFDPGARFGVRKKNDGARLLMRSVELLAEYQARLAAQDTYGVLVVLQGMDAAGKDSTIRHVMSGVNPQGVHVSSFKVPSAEELGHDYLWRLDRRLPARGEIGIFNRSHYEEVLAVRVHPEDLDREKLPPESQDHGVWRRRFREINDWEHYLTDNGIRLVKLFLNVSKENSGPASCSGLTSRRRTGNSPRPIYGSGSTGMSTSMPMRRCSPIPAPSGLRGMSCLPTTNGSPGSVPQLSSRRRSSTSTRDIRSPMQPPARNCCRREPSLRPRHRDLPARDPSALGPVTSFTG